MGIDPLPLDDATWLTKVSLALWLENRQYTKEAKMLAQLFSSGG